MEPRPPRPGLRFRLLLQAKNRSERPVVGLMRRGFGGLPGAAIAVVEGALLVAPGGALGWIDLPVVIGVDAVEAVAEAAVPGKIGRAGQPVGIRLHLLAPRILVWRGVGGRERGKRDCAAHVARSEPAC